MTAVPCPLDRRSTSRFIIGKCFPSTHLWRSIKLMVALAAAPFWSGAGMTQTAGRLVAAGNAAPPEPAYADLADLVLAAPIIAEVNIHDVSRLKEAVPAATPMPAGRLQLYVEADVVALIRGPGELPARIGYVADVATDARGRMPHLAKTRVLIFARPVAGQTTLVQLVGAGAQQNWNPAIAALVRTIAQAVQAPDAPPSIDGIGRAFHVPGALLGDGDTRFFLTTTAQPVSIEVATRGGMRSWSVSLGDLVDQAAPPPARDTLLWYRLACTLPSALPANAVDDAAAVDAAAARDDYAFVIAALGGCNRSPPSE